MTHTRDPRAEADAVLPDGYEARVLESSPPAVIVEPFADDPVDPRGAAGIVVSPFSGTGRQWLDLADDPSVADLARGRWLGPYPDVEPLPDTFGVTRDGLAKLALHVVYRMRRRANGKYGLRWTLGGFGTPFYVHDDGPDEQVRVSGGALVHQRGEEVRVEPITSLARAAEFLGLELDVEFDHGFSDVIDAGDPSADLHIDPGAALALGNWFGLAWSVLEEVRHTRRDGAPTIVQLWPEHFDAAIDLAWGSGPDQRANVGFSPGDDFHADPYLYIGPWTADRPGGVEMWNAPFGAVLGYETLLGPGDAARDRALDFVASRLMALVSGGLDRAD